MFSPQAKRSADRYIAWRLDRLEKKLARWKLGTPIYEAVHDEMKSRIPVIMVIDVEPDGFFIKRDDPVPWAGYETTYKFLRQLRPILATKTGAPVHYSWYFRFDPQVEEVYGSAAWAATRYREYIDDFLGNGDELGLHPHDYRWDAALNEWVVDHGNQPWIDHCVKLAFEVFRSTFAGRQCESFRFGDRWMNDETLRLIESLGARFDLTVEPGQGAKPATRPNKPFSGSLPDYTHAPLKPYRPSKEDFTKADATRRDGIWMIPISSSVYDTGPLSTLWRGLTEDPPHVSSYYTLNMRYDSRFFGRAVDRLLRSTKPLYLTFVIRTDIGTDSQTMKTMQDNFNRVLSHRLANRFVFSTPAEAMTILGLEPSRNLTISAPCPSVVPLGR